MFIVERLDLGFQSVELALGLWIVGVVLSKFPFGLINLVQFLENLGKVFTFLMSDLSSWE